jgi:hypothetical protein
VVTVATVSVAGCVGMPGNGPVGVISASPQSTVAGGNVIQPFPAGPAPHDSPFGIVTGFLAASANPLNAAIAREYLVSSAAKAWKPGWSVTVFSNFGPTPTAAPRPGARQTRIVASGTVQSAFNGSGQFVSAGSTAVGSRYGFRLTKVNGQWRISNPPSQRLLTASEFTAYYKPQDLYFLLPSGFNNPSVLAGVEEQPLVPDSVFVPQGTSSSDLLNNLVTALLPNADGTTQSPLLTTAVQTFPPGTKLVSVALAGTTAVVNLSGLAGASKSTLEGVSAQLAWTLASPRSFPPAPIQSIELERDGHPWTPPGTICGVPQIRSQVQNQATYSCYNPYPSAPAIVSFTGGSQVWSRCGSEDNAQRGLVGPVISLLSRPSKVPACASSPVPATSSVTPAPVSLPAGLGAPSLVAVSPDGQYVAAYWPAAKELFTWQTSTGFRLGQANQVKAVTSGVTALSWDRSDDLWFAQNGNVYTVPANGQAAEITGPQGVTDLAVAPDGIRIAFIAPDGPKRVVYLAAIIRNPSSSPGNKPPSEIAASISPDYVHLGPDLIQPQDLTWYDADDLIVLARNDVPTLSQVPVDGQESLATWPAPPGANSITANGTMNALVAGLSTGQLVVSTSLEGPWQVLSVRGRNPAYPG